MFFHRGENILRTVGQGGFELALIDADSGRARHRTLPLTDLIDRIRIEEIADNDVQIVVLDIQFRRIAHECSDVIAALERLVHQLLAPVPPVAPNISNALRHLRLRVQVQVQ